MQGVLELCLAAELQTVVHRSCSRKRTPGGGAVNASLVSTKHAEELGGGVVEMSP